MPTNFPTSVDNFTNPTANDSLNLPSHSTQHANANDAIEAVEDYLLNGAGRSGLVLVKSQTIGTGVTTVAVTGAFSATYDAYRIVVIGGVTSTSEALNFQLGPIGVSQYDNQYYQNIIYTNFAGAAPAAAFTSNGTFFPFNIYSFGVNGYNASFEVFSPFRTTYTEVQGLRGGIAGGANVGPAVGFHNSLNSFSGFQLITTGGTMTGGTIYVYGYRKS
jgi:hypothetical protein